MTKNKLTMSVIYTEYIFEFLYENLCIFASSSSCRSEEGNRKTQNLDVLRLLHLIDICHSHLFLLFLLFFAFNRIILSQIIQTP